MKHYPWQFSSAGLFWTLAVVLLIGVSIGVSSR
jgi:hypothetical protein